CYRGSFGSGIVITDSGNRSPPTVGIFGWNSTATVWDPAPLGIRDLVVRDGDVVALTDTAYDPVTYRSYPPAPTPESPFPVTQFRGDLVNSGTSASATPDNPGVRWDRATGARESPATPPGAYGEAFAGPRHRALALAVGTRGLGWTHA